MARDDKSSPADILQDIITTGRKRAMNFALMKSKEGVVLRAHHTKGTDAMFREAKAAGGMAAVSVVGLLNVSGKKIELTVATEDVPRNLPKLAKKYFSSIGVPYKVGFILPGGAEVGDEDEDEDGPEAAAPAEPDAPATPEEPPPEDNTDSILKAELTERLRKIGAMVREAADAGSPAAEKLRADLKTTAGKIGEGAFDTAKALLDETEAALAALSAKVDPDALRAQLQAEFQALETGLTRLTEEGEKTVAKKATQIVGMFRIELDRDLKKTAQILTLLRKFAETEVAKLSPAPPQPAPAPSGPGTGADTGADSEENSVFSRIKNAIFGSGEDAAQVIEEGVSVFTNMLGRLETAIAEGIQDVNAFLKDKADLLQMATAYPEAALASYAAIEAFDETLGGDIVITPEVLSKAAGDVALAATTVADAKKALATANAMKRGGTRNKAVKAAVKALVEAEAAQKKAIEFEKAAKGKNLLETEMTIGALAPDSNRKLSQEAALELVKGASRDPDLASVAFTATRDGQYPEDVAKNLGKLIDLKEGGFAADGKKSNPEASADYANKLLTMGGDVGPEYFARMDAYIASGRQYIADPTNESATTTFGEMEQSRTMSVGKALIGPDGRLALDTPAANDAIGDAMFNPEVLAYPRPALTSHMLETVNFLKDPVNAQKANQILADIPEPTDPVAAAITRRANQKAGTDPVGKGDVQGAVMATMLKSIDQGPVGSCFATAPARRLRETDPLAAMASYAQIAGTGKYDPPFGPEVPAVTNTQPGDDPIMRSFEYSLATSSAQRANSRQKRVVNYAGNAGMDTLGDAVKTGNLAAIALLPPDEQAEKIAAENAAAVLRLSKLKQDMAAAFTFVYDPMDETGKSADGRSKFGRYILVRIAPEKEIRSKADFIGAMTEIALSSLGIADNAPEAQAIKDHVKSDTFIDAVTKVFGNDKKDEYLPWAMGGGGQTDEATQTLHGATLSQQSLAAEAGKPPPDEGERTKTVVLGMLNSMADKTGEMITVRTVGQHGFNALPNDPSLDKLKGDTPEEREENFRKHIADPGAEIRDKKISEKRVLQMFTSLVQPQIDKEADAGIKALLQAGFDAQKPTEALSPAELDKAVSDALKAANSKRAELEAAAWKAAETDPVTDEKLAEKQAELEKEKQEKAAGLLATTLVEFCAPPEFVIADTNWGSGADHTFFVIAPDPATGKPLLWTKTIPDGKLVKAGRDWVDHEWAMIE